MKRAASPASADAVIDLDALTGDLANLRALAGDAMMQEACGLLRERLKLTPEKLMLLMLRRVNPEEIVQKGEEAHLRGVRHETLAGHKDRRELPVLINGILDQRQG